MWSCLFPSLSSTSRYNNVWVSFLPSMPTHTRLSACVERMDSDLILAASICRKILFLSIIKSSMFTSGLRRPQFLKSKMRALPRLAQHEWKFHSVPTPWRNVVSLSDCTTHEMVELHMCHRRNFCLGLLTTNILGREAGFQIHQPKLFSLLTAALSIDPSWKDPRKVVFCRWSFRYSLSVRGTFFSLSHSQNNASISQSGIQSLVLVWVFKGNLHWHNVMSNQVSKDCSKFIFWRDVKGKNSHISKVFLHFTRF